MVSSNIKMFLTFAPPKASPVLYKAVVYVPKGVETPRNMPGPIDKQPTVSFDTIFAKISVIRANIDASIVEVVLNNDKSYLFYGDIITPESNSIEYDNVVRIQSHATWKNIVRASTSKKTCVAIQAVFGS
jgi:hypothetical protein